MGSALTIIRRPLAPTTLIGPIGQWQGADRAAPAVTYRSLDVSHRFAPFLNPDDRYAESCQLSRRRVARGVSRRFAGVAHRHRYADPVRGSGEALRLALAAQPRRA